MFQVTISPIDVNALLRSTATEEDGGIAIFAGVVRRHTGAQEVSHLEYEAYTEMALRSFESIAKEIKASLGVERLSIVHRTGRLAVGEIAVAIVAASPHRKEAFAACQVAIDRLKEISPIWKKDLEVCRV